MRALVINAHLLEVEDGDASGSLRLCLEVPARRALDVLGAFGFGQVGRVPVALLPRTEPDPPPREEPKRKRRFDEIRPSNQAGMLCDRPAFWRFLRERLGADVENQEQAAAAVREICGVTSRRELHPGSQAAACWAQINADFDLWMREPAL